MKGLTPAEFIADLYELKRSLIEPLPDRYLQPNVTYAVLETLIATFYDKYKVSNREVEYILINRKSDELLG